MCKGNAVDAVENFWREVWQPPQNPGAIDHLVSDDFVLTSGGIDLVSRTKFKEWVIEFQSKIKHLEFDIVETFQNAEGTRVALLADTRQEQRDLRNQSGSTRYPLYGDRSLGSPARRRSPAQ